MKLREQIEKEYADLQEKEIIKDTFTNKSPGLNLILEKYEKFFSPTVTFLSGSERMYKYAKSLIKNVDFTKEDITHFSFHLEKFTNHLFFGEVGIFISALINQNYEINRSQKEYILHTSATEKLINRIGYENNGAHILVVGNVGDFTAHGMRRGKITVQGKAESHLGYFIEGGILEIEQARCFLGCQMNGGKIYVNHAGGMVGHGMHSGEIHIKTDYASFGEEVKGTIFYRGEKIKYPKRKR